MIIASAHGIVASPFKSAYVSAKHGVVGLTKVPALEGAGHGIGAVAICPGYVRTPLVEGQIPGTGSGPSHGGGRGVTGGDPGSPCSRGTGRAGGRVADTVVFLLTDAGQAFTGVPLVVMDMGWSAR